jgi:uncharacterized protein (DUF58 family)
MLRRQLRRPRRFFDGRPCRRSIRLTTEGTRFLLFALAVAIAAVNTGNNLFYLLLAMMLSLVIISSLLSEVSLRRLAFRRQVPAYAFANEQAQISLMVSNQKAHFPSFSLRLFDMVDGKEIDREASIFHLPPRTSRLVTYTVQTARRGLYRMEGIRIVTSFPFGLSLKKALYADETSLLVCPPLIPLPLPVLQELAAIGQDHGLGRRGPGMALYNLREYRPGDDSRAIHWMTTARTSKLMLKETEADDQRTVTIVLSTIAPAGEDAAFERAVSVTASLATYFHDRGYLIRAVIGEEEIGPATGAAHCIRILRALALCDRQEPGAAGSNPEPYLPPAQPGSGIVLGVTAAPADQAAANRLASADGIIMTGTAGEPVYVAHAGLSS